MIDFHDHESVPPQAAILISVMRAAPAPPRAGWCYAGVDDGAQLLKLGGTSGCPLCRVHGRQLVAGTRRRAQLRPLAAVWCEDWRVAEQQLLAAAAELAAPQHGTEWFAWSAALLDELVEQGRLHTMMTFALEAARRLEAVD